MMMSAAMFVPGLSTVFVALPVAALMIEQFSSRLARLKRHLATTKRAMGVLMVLTGMGFLTGSMPALQLANGEFSLVG
jgi:cytochrome c-type biogenesis protein